jgi:DNA-binding protein H-NS
MATAQELMARKAALEKQTAELEKEINAARRSERSGVISQIKALMAEHGLTVADLGGRGKTAKAKPGRPRKSSTLAGKKVPAKYRNKSTGESWSGRGLQPKWLKAALATGKKMADFEV